MNLLTRLIVQPSLRDDDTPLERKNKNVALIPIVIALLCKMYFLVMSISHSTGIFPAVMYSMQVLVALPCLIFAWGLKRLPIFTLEIHLVGDLICILCFDLYDFGRYDEWVITFIILPAMLLTEVRSRVVNFSSYVVVVHIIVRTAEEAFRFGIYDLHSKSNPGPLPALGMDWFINIIIVRLLAFTLNVIMTKRFASGLLSEQAKMQESISVSAAIACSLAQFDLVSAGHTIDQCENLDEEQLFGYRQLLRNLNVYRPFLPDALFVDEPGYAERVVPMRPPPKGEVTIVFTDIENSSGLWEKLTDMRGALALHNETIRAVIDECYGYEVKTIGDSFMVAFDTPMQAMTFGLNSQMRLLEAPWEDEVLQQQGCMEESDGAGNVIWRGLRVRMGIHTGAVELELNPLTNRADYIGNAVNVAARIEGMVRGGVVAVSQKVLIAAGQASNEAGDPTLVALRALGTPVMVDYGMLKLSGISSKVHVLGLVPAMLERRRDHVSLLKKPKQRTSTTSRHSVQVSEDSASLKGDLPAPVARTANLAASMASLTHIQVDFLSTADVLGSMNTLLAVVEQMIDREGLISNTFGDFISVTWNAARRIRNPFERAAQFSAELVNSTDVVLACSDIRLTVGIVHSGVMHGMVGSNRKKYATVVGWAPRLATMLCADAMELGADILAVSTSEDLMATTLFLRPVLEWSVRDRTTQLTVYEVKAVDSWEQGGSRISPNRAAEDMWGKNYREAWEEARQGDVTHMQRLLSLAEDAVASRALLTLQAPRRTVDPGVDPYCHLDPVRD